MPTITSTLPKAPITPFDVNAPSTLTITPPSAVSPVQPQQTQSVSQVSTQPMNIEGTQVDPSIVALMHGLKTAEGAVGNYTAIGDGGTAAGAGQWSNQFNGKVQPLKAGDIPNNFKGEAQTYGFDPNDFSPENQNKVLYAEIAAGKRAGLSPEQILSKHNSGDVNKYLTSPTGSGQVGAYDVAAYVKRGMTAAQQYASQNAQNAPQQPGQAQAEEAPSVGGFGANIVKSGANFLGNIGEAALHPIQTVQNIGGAAVGGLQELGGQQTDETAKFDNLKNYFINRYGGVSNLESTIYSDPVGFLGDLSAVLGTGAGIAGAVGKIGELSTVADAGAASDAALATGVRTMAGDQAIGNSLTRGAATAKSALGAASTLTNPLALPVMGAGAVVGKLAKPVTSLLTNISQKGIQIIADNPEEFTASKIAAASREDLGTEIGDALNQKIAEKSETGSAYSSYKETPSAIQVAPDFLDNALREHAGVDVTDGVIKGTSGSAIRDTGDIRELQDIYNRYKPDFLAGTMDSNKFLNLREDLSKTANFNKGLSKDIQFAAQKVRENLNKDYRSQVTGLEETDTTYAQQAEDLKTLRAGLIDKNGKLLKTATNKIANAGGKGKGDLLNQLEEIIPGITKRIEIQKVMEEIDKAADFKGGAYVKTVGEVAIGSKNLPLAAGALATAILTHPSIAVPLIRAIGGNQALLSMVMYKLAQAANLPTTLNRATNTQAQETQSSTDQQTPTGQSTDRTQSQQGQPTSQSQLSSSDLTSLAASKNFDLDAARAANYSDADILSFLQSQK